MSRVSWSVASDIHFKAGASPLIRINGKLVTTDFESFSSSRIEQLAYKLMKPAQKQIFEREKELDFSYMIAGILNLHPREAMQLMELPEDDNDKYDFEKFYELLSSDEDA